MKGILFLTVSVALLVGAAWAASPEVIPPRPGLLTAQDLFTAGDYRGAERVLRGCDGPTSKLLLAKACVKQGLLEDAAAALDAVLEEKPNNPESLELMVQVAVQRGRLDVASIGLRRMVKEDPMNPALHKALAHCEAKQGSPLAALASANQALSLDPSDAEALSLVTELATNGINKLLPQTTPGNRRPNHGRR